MIENPTQPGQLFFHGVETMANIAYGVATARRAWLTRENVANTRGWEEFSPLRKHAR